MRFYKDYIDDYSDEEVEAINKAYAQEFNTNVSTCERNEYFIDKQISILNEKLSKCCNALEDILSYDKKNKNFLSEAITLTKQNNVEISNCCRNKCDFDCLYYSTACPDFNSCCNNYCNCEWELINKILFLLTIKNLPISQLILFDLLRCRVNILQNVYSLYLKKD